MNAKKNEMLDSLKKISILEINKKMLTLNKMNVIKIDEENVMNFSSSPNSNTIKLLSNFVGAICC